MAKKAVSYLKSDLTKNWPNSPFHEYQCNKVGNHFVIEKKHMKVNCASEGCNRWTNKNCGHKMCKKCCMELQWKSMKSSACSTADRRLPTTGLDVTDGDNAVTGEWELDGRGILWLRAGLRQRTIKWTNEQHFNSACSLQNLILKCTAH